jgi:hypothetical protein
MSSKDNIITVLDEPLVEKNIYRFFMYVGFIALLGALVIYLMELVIYPQYWHVMLTEGLYQSLVFNEQLNLIHSLDTIITVSVGLGFFGIFAKYGRKSGYIFLLLFIFPIFSFQQIIFDFFAGVTTIDASVIAYMSGMGPAIGKSVILAFLLFHALWLVADKRVLGISISTLVASQIAQVVWHYSTLHLAPIYDFSHFDFTQWTVTGTLENAMTIGIPRILGAIVFAIVFATFMVFEIRNDKESVEERFEETEVIESTSKGIVISR